MIELTRFGHWHGEKSDMTQKLSCGWLGELWGHEQKPGSQEGSACLGVYDEVIVAKLRFRVMLVEMFLEAVDDSEHVSEGVVYQREEVGVIQKWSPNDLILWKLKFLSHLGKWERRKWSFNRPAAIYSTKIQTAYISVSCLGKTHWWWAMRKLFWASVQEHKAFLLVASDSKPPP